MVIPGADLYVASMILTITLVVIGTYWLLLLLLISTSLTLAATEEREAKRDSNMF